MWKPRTAASIESAGSEAAGMQSIPGAERHDFGSGATVFREGDRVDMVHCVSSGCVAVVKTCNGGEVITAVVGEGGTLGVHALMCGGCHHDTAIALGPVVLCSISAAAFLDYAARCPGILIGAMRDFCSRLAVLDLRIEALGGVSSASALA